MRGLLIAGFFVGCSGSPKSTPVAPNPPQPTEASGEAGRTTSHGAEPKTPEPAPRSGADPDTPEGAAAKRDAELAATVIPYIDAFTNTRPIFTRDGKRIIFKSTRDGLPQVYVSTIDGAATRIGAHPQRIGEILAAPGGKDLLFSSDTNGDEHWSFFRIGLDGKNQIELTPNQKLFRDKIVVPDGRPSQLYFTARAMSEAKSTLYVTSATAAAPPKAIYTDDKVMVLRAVSSDGKFALAGRIAGALNDNHLVRVDVETGAAEKLFPADGKVAIFDTALARDNKRVYVATDNGEEQALVLMLDAKTGKQLAKRAFTPPTARVSGIAVAKEGGLVAVTIEVGARSEIHLVDGRTLAERSTIAMPPGSGGAAEFSDDGKQLLVHWSTPDRPHDLYVVDPKTGKVTPRGERRPGFPDFFSVDASTTEVPAFDGGKIPTNVMLLKGKQTTKQPVAVMFHGGPSGISSIRWSPLVAAMLASGYAVVEPNIRGSIGFGRAYQNADNYKKRGDSFKDVESVTRWVAGQPWADKDRLVVMGASWGGYLTLIALTRFPELYRAGVNIFGVVNLRTTIATTSGVNRQTSTDEIGDPERDAAFLDSVSPITDIAKVVDPVFVFAGATDPRVPRAESDMVVRALRTRKVPVEYMVAENEGHSLARRETQVALYARMLRFLELHLK